MDLHSLPDRWPVPQLMTLEYVHCNPLMLVHSTILQTDPSIAVLSHRSLRQTSIDDADRYVAMFMATVDVVRGQLALACLHQGTNYGSQVIREPHAYVIEDASAFIAESRAVTRVIR